MLYGELEDTDADGLGDATETGLADGEDDLPEDNGVALGAGLADAFGDAAETGLADAEDDEREDEARVALESGLAEAVEGAGLPEVDAVRLLRFRAEALLIAFLRIDLPRRVVVLVVPLSRDE